MAQHASEEIEVDFVKPVQLTNSPSTRSQPGGLDDIKELVSRYVGQLVNGCGHAECREILCDTGRRNTSDRPVRKYTPRSARIMAISIISGPRPRSRLCPRYSSTQTQVDSPSSGDRIDSAAFVQQFGEAQSIRDMCASSVKAQIVHNVAEDKGTLSRSERRLEEISTTKADLNCILHEIASICMDPTIEAITNERFMKGIPLQLARILQGLLSKLPEIRKYPLLTVDLVVSYGGAYLPEVSQDVTLSREKVAILDALQDDSRNRLLCSILRATASAIELEQGITTNLEESLPDAPWDRFGKHRPFIERLVESVFRVTPAENMVFQLVIWLKKVFLQFWDGKPYISAKTIEAECLRLLGHMHRHLSPRPLTRNMPEIEFWISSVMRRIDPVFMAKSWFDSEFDSYASGRTSSLYSCGHVLNYSFLFIVEDHAAYFRAMNHLRMRKAIVNAKITTEMRTLHVKRALRADRLWDANVKSLEEQYLLLSVSRKNVLQDAFDQLWQRHSYELLRPLRVRLGEMDSFEVGQDLGGVQIEFFNMICREMFLPSAQLFTTDLTTGYSFFTPGSLQPLYMFELCGLLFALALYNGISLPASLPIGFYMTLKGQPQGAPCEIADGWPIISKSLQSILDQDISDVDMTYALEANGVRLTILRPGGQGYEDKNTDPKRMMLLVSDATPIRHHKDIDSAVNLANEGAEHAEYHVPSTFDTLNARVDLDNIATAWPGWYLQKTDKQPQEATNENKKEYVRSYVFWLTWLSVRPQFSAFLNGFRRMYGWNELRTLTPTNLRTLLEGTTNLDIWELRSVTQYEVYTSKSPEIKNFWHVVVSWPAEKQKLLLKFVTACERIPAGGVGNLTFKIKKTYGAAEGNLPTSSTCFGTLMLPAYESREVMEEKLSLALDFGAEGFGTA